MNKLDDVLMFIFGFVLIAILMLSIAIPLAIFIFDEEGIAVIYMNISCLLSLIFLSGLYINWLVIPISKKIYRIYHPLPKVTKEQSAKDLEEIAHECKRRHRGCGTCPFKEYQWCCMGQRNMTKKELETEVEIDE